MTLTKTSDDAVAVAAARLQLAYDQATPCPPVRDLIGADDLDLAYAVQRIGRDHRIAHGAQRVGWKIGLTSAAVQKQLGVDRPDFGVLFDDMVRPGDEPIPVVQLLQPKIEAEVAFMLASDLDGATDPDAVRRAIGWAVAAFEIVDSRVAGWDITIADTVADNASSGLYVLGADRRTLDEIETTSIAMQMTKDGATVSSGIGADCLGDPINAVSWLATAAASYGDPLRAGDLILSGALGPMVAVQAGSFVAELSQLGAVHATFV